VAAKVKPASAASPYAADYGSRDAEAEFRKIKATSNS
jgi:hypothetical protein